jgi:hypothetical protein
MERAIDARREKSPPVARALLVVGRVIDLVHDPLRFYARVTKDCRT